MKKAGIVLLCIIIVVFNILIGANEKELRVIPISVLMLLTLIYLLIIKIKTKETKIFFKNKLDIFVFVFMLTTSLPLIFGTCASYSDAVEFCIKYSFIYLVYILARNVITKKEEVETIITVIIASSLIPIILQFLYLNISFMHGIMKWLDLIYEKGNEFNGTFGYANAQAIYIALCMFLAVHKIQNSEKKSVKVISLLYIAFTSYILLLTKCRVIIALLLLILIIYLIKKYKQVIIKHKYKFLAGFIILIALVIGFLVYAINIAKDINKTNLVDQIIKYRFKPNTSYSIEFDLKAEYTGEKAELLKTKPFTITILKGNKYFNEFIISKESIDSFDGKYKVEFELEEEITFLRIKIDNPYHRKNMLRWQMQNK